MTTGISSPLIRASEPAAAYGPAEQYAPDSRAAAGRHAAFGNGHVQLDLPPDDVFHTREFNHIRKLNNVANVQYRRGVGFAFRVDNRKVDARVAILLHMDDVRVRARYAYACIVAPVLPADRDVQRQTALLARNRDRHIG
jgi:hypothetical protein